MHHCRHPEYCRLQVGHDAHSVLPVDGSNRCSIIFETSLCVHRYILFSSQGSIVNRRPPFRQVHHNAHCYGREILTAARNERVDQSCQSVWMAISSLDLRQSPISIIPTSSVIGVVAFLRCGGATAEVTVSIPPSQMWPLLEPYPRVSNLCLSKRTSRKASIAERTVELHTYSPQGLPHKPASAILTPFPFQTNCSPTSLARRNNPYSRSFGNHASSSLVA